MAENQEVEHVDAIAVTTSALEQMERANIDIQIATAHKYPKHDREHIEQVKKDILDIATLNETIAADCFYVLPRGGKSIDGPSIRMAEIAISCYGNIRDSVRTIEVVARGPEPHVVVQAVCHDLEKNVLVSIEKRRRITKKRKNQFVDEDDINLAVNSAASFGLRDAAFRVIPRALINPIVDACKRIALGDVKSLVAKRNLCIERLNKMGATTDRILSVLECESVEQIGTSQLEVLIGLGTALKDGQCTLEEAFPPIQSEQKGSTAERIKERFDKPKTKTKAEKDRDARVKKKAKLAAAEAKAKSEKEKSEKEPETTSAPPPETEEPKLVKCPICSEEVDPKIQHDCSEPGDTQTTTTEAEPTTVGKDTHKCMRCERQFPKPTTDNCPFCMGQIAELT